MSEESVYFGSYSHHLSTNSSKKKPPVLSAYYKCSHLLYSFLFVELYLSFMNIYNYRQIPMDKSIVLRLSSYRVKGLSFSNGGRV